MNFSRFFISIAALVASASSAVAVAPPPGSNFPVPDGGCHYIAVTDSLTGSHNLVPAGHHRIHSASTADGLGQYGTSGLGPVSTIGEITIPVIMVDFSDVSFLPTTTIAKVEAWFNGENYTDNGNVGSVRQYFIDQSGGMFRPTFKVMGISHTGKPVATYGAGSSNQEKVEELSHAVTPNYDFSSVTRLQSGVVNYVPLCVIYYAGGGDHRGAGSDRIWAKFVEYPSYSYPSLFGQRFKSYLYVNEANGNEMDGVGTACHELCHAFGLPDVYDTSGGNCRTPGLWSLMSAGNYAQDGHSPVDLCAYERSMLGWLRIKELSSAGSYTLAPYEAAMVRNASNNKEYYIMENRSNTKWTPAGMSGGMLVYHIDYDKSAWENKKINVDDSHPRMMFVAADNNQSDATFFDYQRDLYPYLTNDSLTTRSTPAMTAFTGSFAGKPIYNIRRNGNNITFDFITKSNTAPIVTPDQKEVTETKYPDRKLGSPISSLSDIKGDKLYALYNPHFKAYAVYSTYSKSYIWTAGCIGDATHQLNSTKYSRAFNVTSNFSAWKVERTGSHISLQNEASEFYLTTSGDGKSPCAWSETYNTLMVKELGNKTFALTTSGGASDYLCVAPQYSQSPLSTWYSTDDGAAWQIIPIEGSTVPSESVFPICCDAKAENTHSANRTLAYVSLQENSNEEQSVSFSNTKRCYNNATATTFTVSPGSTITPRIGYNGSWMHGYFYIDTNHDGTLTANLTQQSQSGTELLSYSFWTGNEANETSGYDSHGNSVTGDKRNSVIDNTITLPSCTAPTTPGTYVARYKVDWNCVEPGGHGGSNGDGTGTNGILTNGGFIVDVHILVSSPEGIHNAKDNMEATPTYDLCGRKLTTTHRGLYIQNGRVHVK